MEFSMPIRVRWDVDFRGRSERPKRIARAIRAASPLFLELRFDGKRGVSDLPAIFAEMNQGGSRIEATVRLSPETAKVSSAGYPARFRWELDSAGRFPATLPDGAHTISFTPDEDSIAELPGLIEDFADSPWEELVLPNVNAVRALAGKGHVPVPTPERLRRVTGEIARLSVPLNGKRVVVHDFFLWQALKAAFPGAVGERVEFSGCQAGTALAYIDWEGNVYPCDSLPIRLGNLLDAPFEKVWQAPARERLADSIRATPGGCLECAERTGCHGGCRGLAYLADRSFDCPDPSCPQKARERL